jgi:glyoxylase-like metal-dependent hydrolase (beta-lactamase superfamily II)
MSSRSTFPQLVLALVTATVTAVGAGCATPAPLPSNGAGANPGAPEPVVHVHVANEAAFVANAYLVETEHGVVAVDAPFTVSEGKKLRAELDALHKPLLAVLVTHAHPDHVNGIGALVEGSPKTPIYALSGVDRTLRAIDAGKRAYWTPIYEEEYPTATTFPNHIVADGEKVVLDGATFTAIDVGQGESDDETVWRLEGATPHAFVGDLVMNHVHPWLAEGHSAAWLSSLEKAQPAIGASAIVHPGHGAQGDIDALAWQRTYLETYRAAVRELAGGKNALTDDQKKVLTAKMESFLPAAPLSMLIAMGADPVAAELAAESKKP